MKNIKLKTMAVITCLASNSSLSWATDITTAPYTIVKSGYYRVTATLKNNITIEADHVTLDMNGYSIQTTATGSAIMVDPYQNITIKNGFIDTVNGSGISANSASNIVIEKMCITGCNEAIKLNQCNNVTLDQCKVETNTIGYSLSSVTHLVGDRCCAQNNTSCGFSLTGCVNNCFSNCSALKTIGNGTVYAFKSDSGHANVFESCCAENTATLSTQSYDKSVGFYLSNESSSIINNCTVVTVVSHGNSFSYGIFSTSEADEPSIIQNNTIYGVHGDQPGIGLSADSKKTFIVNNISYDNDTAFNYDTVDHIASNQYDHTPVENAAY